MKEQQDVKPTPQPPHLPPPPHTSSMFSSFHPHHHHHHHLHHQLQQLNNRECHASEEEDSHSSGGIAMGTSKRIKTIENIGDGDHGVGSIEVAKRPRGRPPGSKNKPKPPVIITRDAECAMRPYVLEIPSGHDIIDSISRFAHKRNICLSVLTASGSVANVSLRQPSTTPNSSTVVFHGRFDILSISFTHLPSPPSTTSTTPSLNCPLNGLTISLAGPQGQIFGGLVVGGLIAAGTVFIVATSFTNPTYHRLPIEDECGGGGGGGSCSTNEAAQTPTSSNAAVEAPSLYHLPSSDVIWAPTPTRHQHQGTPPPHHF